MLLEIRKLGISTGALSTVGMEEYRTLTNGNCVLHRHFMFESSMLLPMVPTCRIAIQGGPGVTALIDTDSIKNLRGSWKYSECNDSATYSMTFLFQTFTCVF